MNLEKIKTPRIYTKISTNRGGKVHSKVVSAVPDTGAEMSVAGEDLLEKLRLRRDEICSLQRKKLYALNGTHMEVIDKIIVEISYGG